MLHPEEKQYLRDKAYIQAEREMMEMQEWGEWQEHLKQKPAKIIVEEVKTSFEVVDDDN